MTPQGWHYQYMQYPSPDPMKDARECPFCQSRRLSLWRGPSMYVECLSCGGNGPEVRGRGSIVEDPVLTAIARWNAAKR